MKTFKEYLTESITRTYSGTCGFYAWLNIAQDSFEDILKYFTELKFTPEELVDLHVTVMYSNEAVDLKHVNNESMPDARFVQAVKAIEVDWWEGHDGDGYLVLKLEPQNIKHLHDKWKSVGAKPTFDEFTPHMTLKTPFAKNDELVKTLNNKLKSEPLTIKLLHEQIEDLKE